MIFVTQLELAGNFNDAAFIHDQTWEQAFSKETLMETTLNCMIFGMAMGTSTTSVQALRNMPSAVETRNTKRLASSIIGRMDDISTDEIDRHIENDNTNDLSQWLVAKYDQGGWTDAQRAAVANYVRATVAQKAQRNFKDMQLQEEVNAMEERVDDMTNRQSGDVIEANFMVDGQMQTGTIVGGRVSVMENDVMDADGNPRQAYVYNPNLSSVTVAVRMEDGTKKQISARDIESINSVTDAEQYKAERTRELTQAMQDSVKAMYEPPTLSEIWGVDLQPGVMLTINGENWIITEHFDDGRWGFTLANPDGTPNGQSGMVMSDSDLRTAGLLERLIAMLQQGASEEEMDDVVSDLNAEEGLKNIEASDNEDNIWDAVAGFMQGYFKTNEEGDPIPEESRPEAVAGYLVALQKGDIGKTIGIVDARIAELQTRLMAKPEQVENNGEGVVGMAANQSLADSTAEEIQKQIGFLEMVREGLVAKQEEQAQMKAQQPVSQMEAGTEFPVDWNGTQAVAVVEGRDVDGRNLVTVYDANDRDGLPLQAGIEVSEKNDAEWEARRVRPQEQTEQPPMESAGNGTEQVQPEPQPEPQPTPEPQAQEPQLPRDKDGNIDHAKLDPNNAEMYAAAVNEEADNAMSFAGMGDAEYVKRNVDAAQKAVEKAGKLKPKATGAAQLKAEIADINAKKQAAQSLVDFWGAVQTELERRAAGEQQEEISGNQGGISPNPTVEDGTDRTEATDETAVEKTNNKGYSLSDEVDENGRQFVLNQNGELAFGQIGEETGLTPAPILLSEGIITNPATNDGYGLVHIEARHGDQIRKAGYASVLDFIEEVAKNYEIIKEGKDRDGNQTYLLQLTDKHNNTLVVELSGDGNYWNINTAGIFKTSYGKNRKEVYNRHTTAKQPAETVEASQDAEQGGTQTSSSMNAPTLSEGKGTEKSETESEKQENISETAETPTESAGEGTMVEPSETAAKPKAGRRTSFQKRLEAVGEPRTVEEAILMDIATGGAKFRWGNRASDTKAAKRGIGDLWKYGQKEMRGKIGIIKADGYSIETYVEAIQQGRLMAYSGAASQMAERMDAQELTGIVEGVLQMVNSKADALKAIEDARANEAEEEQRYIRSLQDTEAQARGFEDWEDMQAYDESLRENVLSDDDYIEYSRIIAEQYQQEEYEREQRTREIESETDSGVDESDDQRGVPREGEGSHSLLQAEQAPDTGTDQQPRQGENSPRRDTPDGIPQGADAEGAAEVRAEIERLKAKRANIIAQRDDIQKRYEQANGLFGDTQADESNLFPDQNFLSPELAQATIDGYNRQIKQIDEQIARLESSLRNAEGVRQAEMDILRHVPEAQENGDTGEGGEGERGAEQPRGADDARQGDLAQAEALNYPLSEETDEFGKPFIKAADGSTTFGEVTEDEGLTPAPIKLSLGENYKDEKGGNHGYGMLHIEAGHGEQIRKAGFATIEEFVEQVAKNYDTVREGGVIAGNQTYLLEISDEHNNTLFIQLSRDGSYWNINSAGIFKEKYSRRKPKVATRPALEPGTTADSSGVNNGETGAEPSPAGNSPTTSDGKGTENSGTESEKQENISETAETPMESAGEGTEQTEEPEQAPEQPAEETDEQQEEGSNQELIKGAKWDKTGEPEPFRRSKKGDSHDASYTLGKKTYGITRADADTEEVLLEDYGTYVNIWNAYEKGEVLLSPELAAAIKAKIEYLENNKEEKPKKKSEKTNKTDEAALPTQQTGQANNTTDGADGTDKQTEGVTQTAMEIPQHVTEALGELGIGTEQIHVVTDASQLPKAEGSAYSAIRSGLAVEGWYNIATGEVYLYAPNLSSKERTKEVVLHELVSHKGLRGLLGQGGFDRLCEEVWKAITDADKSRMIAYVAKQDENAAMTAAEYAKAVGDKATRRAAADEYMAHLAERGVEASVWEKVRNAIVKALRKLGFDMKMTDADIRGLLRESYGALTADGHKQTAKIVDHVRFSIAPAAQERRLLNDDENVEARKKLESTAPETATVGEIKAGDGLTARQAAEKWADKNIKEPLEFDTEAGTVVIDKTSIQNSLAHRYGQRKLDAIPTLPKGFEKATYIGSLDDWDRPETTNHYFAYPIIYDGKLNYVFCRARADVNTNRLYIHEVFVADNLKSNALQTAAKLSRSKPHGGIAFYKNILSDVLNAKVQQNSESASGKGENLSEGEQAESQVRFSISKADDAAYMDAVNRGDMETAQRMVDEAAREAGYISDNDFRMSHTAPNGRDGFAKSIANPEGIYPEDLYSPQGYNYYGDGDVSMDKESANIFKRLRGNPDALVKIYRAVPKSLKETKLRNGDWVTINRRYAQEHGEYNIGGGYKIIEDEVPAKFVYTDGNSLHEQGYDDGKEYAYQNTKNNRKLLDAVTYDDQGNVIPLSNRFNKRSGDIRFSITGPDNAIAGEYNRTTGYNSEDVSGYVRVREELLRSFFDGLRPLEQMQQLVEKALGRKLRDSENAYGLATLLPSLNKAMMDKAKTEFMLPVLRRSARIMRRVMRGKGVWLSEARKMLTNYLLAKHGLERNEWFYQQALANDPEARFNDGAIEFTKTW